MEDINNNTKDNRLKSFPWFIFILLFVIPVLPWMWVMAGSMLMHDFWGDQEYVVLTFVWFTYAISYVLAIVALVFYKKRKSYYIPLIHLLIASYLLISMIFSEL